MLCLLLAVVLSPAAAPDFDREVAPLLVARCVDCHSGASPKGGLDLTRRKAALEQVSPGKPDDSPLWQRVRDDEMPPKKPLAPAEKVLLRRWIEGGATWGGDPIDPFRVTTASRAGHDWWSLRPVVAPIPPAVRNAAWPRTPIDRFVLARLEARGLTPSPEADRRTLIRRLSFDLLGLPPAPEEVEAFERDTRPDAYERIVAQMLASPHHGERWGRHWLDVVRFGESDGFERDLPRPNAWPYRDWVVSALNADQPYDQFARLQLAGDVLRPDDPEAIAATGFLVAGPHDIVVPSTESMRETMRQDELEDTVGTIGQTFLGLTVHCARCHEHKFDPLPQADYYRLAAAVSGVRHGERPLRAGRSAPKVYAATAVQPAPTRLLARGSVTSPREVIAPAPLAALADVVGARPVTADAPEGERRVALAEWISGPKNPLFARVMVNRLWQHHFGVGLVDTPSDFGFNGGRPSHPELLDWLAAELPRRGWSLKAVHRLIVTSAVYRQASRSRPEAVAVDADNRLLWRRAPVRLEAEVVRDAMLAAAGALDRRVGGAPYLDFRSYFFKGTQFYDPIEQVGPEHTRRSLYRMGARGGRNPFLDTFDCPDPSATTPRRAVTTTPLQALALANNAFVLHMADLSAARVQRDAGSDPDRQLDRLYLLAYGRLPAPRERELLRRFLARHALAALCRVVFNTGEFVQAE